MRARVSIPAWGKYALGALGIAFVVAALTQSLWRQPNFDYCAELHVQIERVRNGEVTGLAGSVWLARLSSDARGYKRHVFQEWRGDFLGRLSRETLADCLGADWIQASVDPRGAPWVQHSWRFSEGDAPFVTYSEGVADGWRSQIVIDARPR